MYMNIGIDVCFLDWTKYRPRHINIVSTCRKAWGLFLKEPYRIATLIDASAAFDQANVLRSRMYVLPRNC